MKYMPSDSEDTCKMVSQLIYKLTRPVGSDDDITQYAFCWQKDVDGVWWMHWDEDMILPIHKDREAESIEAIRFFVNAGKLSSETAENIIRIAHDNSGGFITLGMVTPAEWRQTMTAEIKVEE